MPDIIRHVNHGHKLRRFWKRRKTFIILLAVVAVMMIACAWPLPRPY